jgi:type I restriction enzyme S subunit
MTPSPTHGLNLKTINALNSVFCHYPKIQKVLLYGSRAKGTHKPGSDIDLTIVAPDLALSDLFKIETEIDNLLLPYQVDLSLFHKIENAELVQHINRVGLNLLK